MTDLVTFGEAVLRLSPPRGQRLATADRFDAFVGGNECSVAVTAAQLGTATAWLSKLPNGPLGRRVVRELRGHGVRTGVAWAEGTRLGTRYLERSGPPRDPDERPDRTGTAMRTVTPEELPLGPVREARAFHVSGVTPALSERTRETTAQLLETAVEAGTTTVFDLGYRSDLWDRERALKTYEALFPLVDVLVVSRADAVGVLGTSDRPVELAHGLATDHDLRTVVVTSDDRGVLGLHDGEVHQHPTFDADTIDAAGSTDALVGGFLTARLEGKEVPTALARGAATAALKRTVEGDVLVTTREEVARVVERGEADGGAR